MTTLINFNTQQLLFKSSPYVTEGEKGTAPSDYYERGWTIVSGIPDAQGAAQYQSEFIAGLDASRLPLHSLFLNRIKLAKADHIPVCDDVIQTEFQILHFDMGMPFHRTSTEQMVVTHVGVYLPATTTHQVGARTRVVELSGLLKPLALPATLVDQRLASYAAAYGDGWGATNTGRLACFARVVDAATAKNKLTADVDKTVGQWFATESHLDSVDAHRKELDFFHRNGIDLKGAEKQILLTPGQLLLIDNLRVIHGRIGRREPGELCNLMFGVEAVTAADVRDIRRSISMLVATASADHQSARREVSDVQSPAA
jgi:hypothetical protein